MQEMRQAYRSILYFGELAAMPISLLQIDQEHNLQHIAHLARANKALLH